MQAPKNGFFYVLDRTNGKVISAEPFSNVNWASHVDLVTGRPIERPGTRPTGNNVVVIEPGPSGAHNWNPMAFSPSTGLVYIPTLDSRFFWQGEANFKHVPGLWNLAYDLSIPMDFSNVGSEQRATSYLLAWDPVNQREAWRADGSGGGALATAGGLVFRGTRTGHFVAHDAASGQEVWSADVQNSGVNGPISYQIGDDQYVAIALGRGAATMMKGAVYRRPICHTRTAWLRLGLGERRRCRITPIHLKTCVHRPLRRSMLNQPLRAGRFIIASVSDVMAVRRVEIEFSLISGSPIIWTTDFGMMSSWAASCRVSEWYRSQML